MGRHAADDGAVVHPIVAAALRHRPTAVAPGTARHGSEFRQRELTAADGEGGLGWPGEPADGTGLGWPADLVTGAGSTEDQPTLVSDEPPVSRRGWRRIFGSTAA